MKDDGLRSFIQKLEDADWLRKIEGADWNLEIGTISQVGAEAKGPALLFDKIKDYPEGYKLLTNSIFTTRKAQRIAFDISDKVSDTEVIKDWKTKWDKYKPVPPVEVESGPIKENVLKGNDINMFKFPVPKWHEHDGGRYIGTGVATYTRDPDEGWVNLGTYRVMIHDEKTVSFYASPGKHATIMREKHWAKGEDCPVVVVFGEDPLIYAASTMPLLWGQAELDFAGYLKGEPVWVIKDADTGLPIPANAEIAVAGFSPPPEKGGLKFEGPFGEWTGYYGSGGADRPFMNVTTLYHRNDPVLHGVGLSRANAGWYPIPIHTAPTLWNRLETAGMPGIQGVWVDGIGGRTIGIVSVKQMYEGHAKAVGTLSATLLSGGAMVGKWIIVVDEDIDPSDWDQVVWAMSSRVDPAIAIDIVPGFLNSPLDPAFSPEQRAQKNFSMAKCIIYACKPYYWRNQFARTNTATDEMKKAVLDKFGKLLSP